MKPIGRDMAEEAEQAEEGEEGADGEDAEGSESTKKKLSGKVLVLFIGAPAFLVVIIAVVLFLFVFNGKKDEEQLAEAEPEIDLPAADQPVYYELPEMVVNLDNGDAERAVYLKLKVALEVSVENPQEVLDPIMPRIIDRFQIFLRQMRVEDLQGSAGILQLKQELLRRINLAAAPLEIDDVLFNEMVIQ